MQSTATAPRPAVRPELLHALTPSERLVVLHLCEGLSNKEIANVLGKAPGTVKCQVGTAMRKLRVQTRTRLMATLR